MEVIGQSRLSALLPDRRREGSRRQDDGLGLGQLPRRRGSERVVRANRRAGRRASRDARSQDAHRHDGQNETPIRYPSDSRGSAKTSRRFCVERSSARAVRGGDCAHDVSQRATKHRTAAARDHAPLPTTDRARRESSAPSASPMGALLAITRRVLRHAAQTVKERAVAGGRICRGVLVAAWKTMEEMIELGGRVVTQTKLARIQRRDEMPPTRSSACSSPGRGSFTSAAKPTSPRSLARWSRCRRPSGGIVGRHRGC